MRKASPFTKKRIVDVKETDDTLDVEYSKRLSAVKTVRELKDFLADYEEFLPDGLVEFRDADNASCRGIISQKNRIFEHAAKGQMLAEPTEAAALFAPPMIVYPRMFAIDMSRESGKKITWGMAFKKLALEGFVSKLAATQDRMYRKTISIKKLLTGEEENMDLSWKPGEKDLFDKSKF